MDVAIDTADPIVVVIANNLKAIGLGTVEDLPTLFGTGAESDQSPADPVDELLVQPGARTPRV